MRLYNDIDSPLVTTTDGKLTPVWVPIFRALLAAITPNPTQNLIYGTVNGKIGFYSLFSFLTPGSVVQTVVETIDAPATNDTSTYADTGLTATISPHLSTNAIVAVAFQNGVRKDIGDTAVQMQLLRDGTALVQFAKDSGRTGTTQVNDVGTIAGMAYDLPSTTNPVVYSTQFASADNIPTVEVQNNNAMSMLVLLEVTT